ncbi:MAG: hypothetical protein MJE12_08585 [Alphaproteobacteria bacterium]|nr:hypothetical protein [Alphaproteobacteria bacterium]
MALAAAAFVISNGASADPAVDRSACLAEPTQSCVFAIALEESERLHLERMIPRMDIPESKKAQWLESLKDEKGRKALDKLFRTHKGFAIVAAAQAEAGRLDDALKTVETIASIQEQMADWSRRDIAERLARDGDVDGAAAIFATIKDEAARVRAGYAIVSEVAKAGDADKAVVFANRIESPKDRAGMLRRIAQLQAARGDRSGAVKSMALADAAHKGKTLSPRAHIRRLIALGDIEAAKAAATKQTDANVYLKSHWAKAFAIHYARQGRADEAYAQVDAVMHEEILRKAQVQVPGLLATYPEHVEEAMRRADTIADAQLRASALIGVATAMAGRDDLNGVNRVIGMLSEQAHLDRANQSVGWTLARRGALAEAERMIANIKDEEIGRSAIGALAVKQAAAGDIDGARRSIARLPADRRPTLVDEELAVALARSGKARDGIEAALKHWHFETRIRALSRIALVLGAR